MKKLKKTLALMAILSFSVNGFFLSCSSDSGDDEKVVVNNPEDKDPAEEKKEPTVFLETLELSFDSDYIKKAADWSGIPLRSDSDNASALVTRSADSASGYLGRKFWLTDGLYAEFTSAGLGYTNSASDKKHESAEFLKAIESEAITGPFRLCVKTNSKERTFRIYVSKDKSALWTSNPVLEESLSANSALHTYEYEESDSVYIGIGTLPLEADKTVYTSISSIKLESNTAIAEDKWPAKAIFFTNSEITDGKLTLTKDAVLSSNGYQLAAKVLPAYADDQTFTFSASGRKIHVSESGLITLDSDMKENESVTITVKANGGADVSASLEVSVKAEAEDSDKITQTVNELKAILALTGEGSFSYGNTATVLANAKALLDAKKSSFTYSDVVVTPSLDDATGLLTFTLEKGGLSDSSVTVKYSEELAKASVDAAVAMIKALPAFVWNTDAATTLSALNEAISKLVLVDVTASASAAGNGKSVSVLVTNKFLDNVKDESLKVYSPYVLEGKFNLTTKAKEGYTVDEDESGKWTVQQYGEGVSQTHDRITSTAKMDSAGANLQAKANNPGYLTFKLDCALQMTFTDSGKKGIEIFSTDSGTVNGTSVVSTDFAVDSGSKKLGADGKETSVILTAGTYFIYGTGKESAKIASLSFNKVNPASISVTQAYPSEDIKLEQAENGFTFTVSGSLLANASSISWYVDDLKVSGATAASFTLPASSKKGQTYEVRVVVVANEIPYSQSATVLYK